MPLLALTACPGRIDDPDRFKACQLDVEREIFGVGVDGGAKCGTAGCHSATSPQNGLDLVTPGVATRIKTGTSTCQGKPLISFMAEKLTMMPACGSPMPLGDPLTPAEDRCVRDYLASLKDGGR